MTRDQMQKIFTLEFYPFEHNTPAARFVNRVANYARYEPHMELNNDDTKDLQRLFDTYIKSQEAARAS